MLAAGARPKVLALVAALGGSGAGLTMLELTADDAPGGPWVALVAAKGAALLVALALFAYVTWRLWPARARAHALQSPELPALQSRFRLVAVAPGHHLFGSSEGTDRVVGLYERHDWPERTALGEDRHARPRSFIGAHGLLGERIG